MGIGQPQRGRDAAARRRRTRHRRSVPGRGCDHSAGRRLVRGAGARRRRAPPGFAVCGTAGGAGMGDGKSGRTAQRSAGRHGQHAHHHAGACSAPRPQPISPDGLHYTNVATPKQQRETQIVKDKTGRRNCARNRAMDQAGVAEHGHHSFSRAHRSRRHAGKAALEALGAAVELSQALGGTLVAGLYGAEVQPAADADRDLWRAAIPCRRRARLRATRATQPMPPLARRWCARRRRPSSLPPPPRATRA